MRVLRINDCQKFTVALILILRNKNRQSAGLLCDSELIFDKQPTGLTRAPERDLQGALDSATHGRATLVIAHRLATIRHAQQIRVFDYERIVESGTFDELMAKDGAFAAFARAQFMGRAAE